MNKFNLPLLRKAVEWAESEDAKPRRSDSEWCQEFFAVEGAMIGRDCGTAFCIAGWVMHEFAEGDNVIDTYRINGSHEAVDAQDLLGITEVEAWGGWDESGLFSAGNSIEDVRRYAEQIARSHGEEL